MFCTLSGLMTCSEEHCKSEPPLGGKHPPVFFQQPREGLGVFVERQTAVVMHEDVVGDEQLVPGQPRPQAVIVVIVVAQPEYRVETPIRSSISRLIIIRKPISLVVVRSVPVCTACQCSAHTPRVATL